MDINCSICGKALGQDNDPLSEDCGGDCWECIGEIEAGIGDNYAIQQLRKEFLVGLRNNWLPAPKVKYDENSFAIEVYIETPLGEPCINETFELRLYSELIFKRTKVYFDKLVTTCTNGAVIIPIDKKFTLKNCWCRVTRGDRIWAYPIGASKT